MFILLFMFAVVSINVLIDDVSRLEDKNIHIENQYKDLKDTNNNMNQQIEEFNRIDNDIRDIEYLLGVHSSISDDYKKRVDKIKINALERKRMLDIVPNGYPIANRGITGSYGSRIHPILRKTEFHPGIDLRATMRTKIYAPADGVVEYVGSSKRGYGKLIMLNHGYGFTTYYGHLYRYNVRVGDIVTKNQLIALSGNSGLSNGPHLHYEVRFLNKTLNPINFMKWDIRNYNTIFKKEKKVPWPSLKKLMRRQVMLQEQQ